MKLLSVCKPLKSIIAIALLILAMVVVVPAQTVNGQKVIIPLFDRKRVSNIREYPRRYALFEIPEDKATATLYYADHSGAPQGTPDGAALVLNLAGARMAVISSIYRFKVETLDDISALSGVTSFFVYQAPLRG